MTKKWIFDIEVFFNYFGVSFLNTEDKDDIRSFVICWDLGIDDLQKLKAFLDLEVSLLIGYNSISYDANILDFVYNYSGTKINKDLFKLSQDIISREKGGVFSAQKKYAWPNLDLMKLMAFDKLGVSLKQCAINLQWKKIQDLPLPYDHAVQQEDLETILKYNINDVLITYELYIALQEKIELREKLGELYDVDLMSASDSKIANVLLEKMYTQQTNLEIRQIRNLRTKRDFLWLKDCISPKIRFKTKKLNDLKWEIAQTLVVSENNFVYKKKLSFGGNKYELGVGGLHSEDDPEKFISNDNFIIRDADVNSYYPNIIITNNLIPEHLDYNFIEILKNITKERLEAKKNKDKVKADGLKITINSIFGKLGSETFWLQDAKAFLSVTVSGQLFLLMLIEKLVLAGIEVISANTDGIVSRIPRELENKYYELCKEWEKETDFELEYTDYSLYVRSDVNNYITKKASGEFKEKGRYLEEIDLKKGYKYPIIPKCLSDYFLKNREIIDTLKSSDNILDFCISQKTGKDFILEYRTEEKVESLQKTNRFYVSNSGGELVKVRQSNGGEIGLYVGNKTRILNDFDDAIPIENYDINYDFYEEEARKYIGNISDSSSGKYWCEEELCTEDDFTQTSDDNFDVSKIVISQPKFGYSKSNYVFDKENMIVYRGLGSIKYLTATTASELNKASKVKHASFVDLLVYMENNCHVNSRQMESLIKMNFFDCFHKNGKLITIYHEFTEGKNKFNLKLKKETQEKRLAVLHEFENTAPDTKLSFMDQITFEINTFGNILTTYPNLNKKYVYVSRIDLKYSPKLVSRCLATGKEMVLKIQKGIYTQNPFYEGVVLFCRSFSKKPAVTKIDGFFVEKVPLTLEWWIDDYFIVKPEELDKILEEKENA